MGKELNSDTIYYRVNIPLLNKDCIQVKRAGEVWDTRISGMNIRVTIDTQGIHIRSGLLPLFFMLIFVCPLHMHKKCNVLSKYVIFTQNCNKKFISTPTKMG